MVRAFLLSIILVVIFVSGFTIAHFKYNYKISFYNYGEGDFLWQSKKKSVINISLGGEPTTLDPHKAYSMQSRAIIYDMFEGLVQHDPSGEVVLGLAQNYTISNDGLVYTFVLKKDLKWSNGSSLTAEDFVLSYKRLLNIQNKSPYAYLLYNVVGAEDYYRKRIDFADVGIKAKDDQTLEITLKQPVRYFLDQLSHFALSVINVDNFQSLTEAPKMEVEKILTSGAYRFTTSSANGIITAIANNYYYDKNNVKIPEINYYITSNQSLLIKGYRAKYIDLIRTFNTNYLQSLKNAFGSEVKTFPLLGIAYMAFNINNNQFKQLEDKSLRAAINMMIHREDFFISQDSSLENPAYSLIHAQVFSGYREVIPSWKIMRNSKRKETAIDIITNLGYSSFNTVNLNVDCMISNDLMAVTTPVIQSSFTYYPVNVEFSNKECTIYQKDDKILNNSELVFETVIANYNDPSAIFNVVRYGRPERYVGFNNKIFTDKLDLASAVSEQINSYPLYEELEDIIHTEAAVIPLYYLYSKNVVSSIIKGWVDNVLDIHLTKYLYFQD